MHTFGRGLAHGNPNIALEAILTPSTVHRKAREFGLWTDVGVAVMKAGTLHCAVGIRRWKLQRPLPSLRRREGVPEAAEEVTENDVGFRYESRALDDASTAERLGVGLF